MEHTGHVRPNGNPHDTFVTMLYVSRNGPVEPHGAPQNSTESFLRAQLVY